MVLQGNMAFAIGCARCGIHNADGYPGTPSTEVIDRGLSQVQDLIKVGWSINEAVAAAVGYGHTLAGEDCVVTMKIPGLFQAGDIFSSAAMVRQERGALIYYIASDFTPSSTRHLVDPRYFFKSCMTPVLEPRNHQEMLEAASIAVKVGREYKTPVVILASGDLCRCEGMVRLNEPERRDPVQMSGDMQDLMNLPAIVRTSYDSCLTQRMPSLAQMAETSPLNKWEKGSGKTGVTTYGVNDSYVREVKQVFVADLDILSLAFTNPLPHRLIRDFCDSITGDIHVFEDGFEYLQAELERMGVRVKGKERFSTVTEWTPSTVARALNYQVTASPISTPPVPRPPMRWTS